MSESIESARTTLIYTTLVMILILGGSLGGVWIVTAPRLTKTPLDLPIPIVIIAAVALVGGAIYWIVWLFHTRARHTLLERVVVCAIRVYTLAMSIISLSITAYWIPLVGTCLMGLILFADLAGIYIVYLLPDSLWCVQVYSMEIAWTTYLLSIGALRTISSKGLDSWLDRASLICLPVVCLISILSGLIFLSWMGPLFVGIIIFGVLLQQPSFTMQIEGYCLLALVVISSVGIGIYLALKGRTAPSEPERRLLLQRTSVQLVPN
ncbi:hypothetical protein GMRT_13221 [Giardia muris]|uniref:Uncharacterized protein n=1 Tax=Giardia muris TaxID=5742 RepID=A0A4Z1SUR3_GIAMU|nr:hypothetical protein GMRT_13221 [Giardia muris]|eukprot:TNJ28695.1 hypothetical protein GMRT_13221 [Giardia muris]